MTSTKAGLVPGVDYGPATRLRELPGYMTVAATAELFGVTKESVFYMIYEQKAFQHVYKIGSTEETKRPVVVILASEVTRCSTWDARGSS